MLGINRKVFLRSSSKVRHLDIIPVEMDRGWWLTTSGTQKGDLVKIRAAHFWTILGILWRVNEEDVMNCTKTGLLRTGRKQALHGSHTRAKFQREGCQQHCLTAQRQWKMRAESAHWSLKWGNRQSSGREAMENVLRKWDWPHRNRKGSVVREACNTKVVNHSTLPVVFFTLYSLGLYGAHPPSSQIQLHRVLFFVFVMNAWP